MELPKFGARVGLDNEQQQQQPKGNEMNAQRTKRWPTMWHVSDVAAGFEYIAQGQGQWCMVDALYEEFYHQPLVHSTFNKNWAWFNDCAPQALKVQFISYGRSKQGLWPHFLRAVHKGEDSQSQSGSRTDSDLDSDRSRPQPEQLDNTQPCAEYTAASDSQFETDSDSQPQPAPLDNALRHLEA